MQPENLGTLLFGGEIDEEDFVKAALAHEFRRKLLDIIGGGDNENRRFLFLHPGDQAAEYPRLRAAVALHAANAGKALIHLVDPKNAGSHGLGDLDHFPGTGFRFADIAAHQPAHIQP